MTGGGRRPPMFDQETLRRMGEERARLAPVTALGYRDRIELEGPMKHDDYIHLPGDILVVERPMHSPGAPDPAVLSVDLIDEQRRVHRGVPADELLAAGFKRRQPPADEDPF